MAHKTLVGGTAYNITGGKSMVSGTVYNIKNGLTAINGTNYQINFNSVDSDGPPTAMIYSDKNMIFQHGNTVASGKTLSASYTDFVNTTFSDGGRPWYSYRNNVTTVSFHPNFTTTILSYWFANFKNLTTATMNNLNINAVTNMYRIFYNCSNLQTSAPICGKQVTNMSYAYYNCVKLTGAAVSDYNVTNLAYAYYNCQNLNGNINGSCSYSTNMAYAYYNCKKLKGKPLSSKAVNMSHAYHNCHNLTGSPYASYNVTDMSSAYENCYNLTGSPATPAAGQKMHRVNMYRAYYECRNLTGKPQIEDTATNMAYCYYNCYKLTGDPVGGDTPNMDYTYYNCQNLTGRPVFGDATTMVYTYYNCIKLTGSPQVSTYILKNMSHTFQYCRNLTGSPDYGVNVTNMSYAYDGCQNLTGAPVCGNSVQNFSSTYRNCYNLTGSPVCNSKVTNMSATYGNCYNLTGSPVCGNSVTDMSYTYEGCYNLTGSPVCGSKVTNMSATYKDCYNLTGSPICGNNVIDMSNAYNNCYNLTGQPVVGAKVTNIAGAYYNCSNISNIAYIYSASITNALGCFANKNNARQLDIYMLKNSMTNNVMHYNNTASIIGENIVWNDAGSYQYNTNYNIYLYPVTNINAIKSFHQNGGIYVDDINDRRLEPNTEQSYNLLFFTTEATTPQVSLVSNNETVVSVSNVSLNSNNIAFTLQSHEIESTATLTFTLTQGTLSTTQTFVVTVQTLTTDYDVEPISGVTYGFTLNESGYYESSNAGVDSSYSLCKVNILADGVNNVYLDCINYGESNYDYGILSKVDTTLTASATADTSNVFKSFKGSQSASVQTVDYGVLSAGEHFIYVKYIKDSSVNSNNDSLQFTVHFETSTTGDVTHSGGSN